MRLAVDAAHGFGGIALDRGKPLGFTLDGRKLEGFAGDTVLSAVLAAGITTYGRLGETPMGLLPGFAPLVSVKGGPPLPMERLPALDGAELTSIGRRTRLPIGRAHSLGHIIGAHRDAEWSGASVETTLVADLLIVGGGVAGLSAADAAASAGKTVILVERRPWLGGDARYFGPVGEEDDPGTLTTTLADGLIARAGVTVLSNTEAFGFSAGAALVHQIEAGDAPRGRIVAIEAANVVLATGSVQRLPVFSGNRLPGVIPSLTAYHLAKRYGVVLGPTALVATQSNYGYRLALRLHDAGTAVRRVVDTRIHPQSRFVDFAKASGLTLGSGQFPLGAAVIPRQEVRVTLANVGAATSALTMDVHALIVSGGFQPELSLWMLAGGRVRWHDTRLQAAGQLDHVQVAGSAAGLRTLRACAQSGKTAVARMLGQVALPVEDIEIGASFETPDAPTSAAPAGAHGQAFLDGGASLLQRPVTGALATGQALRLGDVTAAVDLGLVASSDAGAVAEERGAPGTPLAASSWTAPPKPGSELPSYLVGRFGANPVRVQLFVDGKRQFETGALVYSRTAERRPLNAIGVVVASAEPGGMVLMAASTLAENDRFVVETLEGPSPARIRA